MGTIIRKENITIEEKNTILRLLLQAAKEELSVE